MEIFIWTVLNDSLFGDVLYLSTKSLSHGNYFKKVLVVYVQDKWYIKDNIYNINN